MAESKIGYTLLLIDGILWILLAIFLITGATFTLVFVEYEIESLPFNPASVFSSIILVSFVILSGVVKLWASNLMKYPESTFRGGIIALVIGVLNGLDLLALVGGSLGVIQGKGKIKRKLKNRVNFRA